MERMAWTDERIDDFAQEMRDFRRETREELRALRADIGSETRGIRADISAMQRQLTQIGFGLAFLLLAQLVVTAVT